MKIREKFRAFTFNGWVRCRSVAWISYCGASLWRSNPARIVLIYRRIRVFLSRIGIEDIRRRDIGVEPRVIPVRRPCPERRPVGPAETPVPTPTESPTAAAPTPAPVPAGPTPSASPTTVPSGPVAVPRQIAGGHAGTVEGRRYGCASNLSSRRSKGVPLSVGYSGVIWNGGRPCRHGGSAGVARIYSTFPTRRAIARRKLMPSWRRIAGVVTFPRPWTSGVCTAWAQGTAAADDPRPPNAGPPP